MITDEIRSSWWIRAVARLGFIAKAVIYFSIGLFALEIAIGMGGEPSGTTQILKHFASQSFGKILLIFCFVGLLAHTAWKFINGWFKIEDLGSGASGLFLRAIEIIVGLIYLSVAYAALQLLTGQGTQSSSQSTDLWFSKIITLPGGKWIVMIIALIIFIVGIYQFYYAYTNGFDYRIDYGSSVRVDDYVVRLLAKIGLSAWGIVYVMIAFLIFQAGRKANPQEAGGLGKALSALQQEPYGRWILGAVGAGLMIYGIYVFILSFYHKNT